jgi:hypothetical protein
VAISLELFGRQDNHISRKTQPAKRAVHGNHQGPSPARERTHDKQVDVTAFIRSPARLRTKQYHPVRMEAGDQSLGGPLDDLLAYHGSLFILEYQSLL